CGRSSPWCGSVGATRRHKDGAYSTNEKLLMIAIANIDLLPTLKELDRILPPPQLRRLVARYLQRMNPDSVKQPKRSTAALTKRTKATKKYARNPYSQRLWRPVSNPTCYAPKVEPKLVVNFPFWARGCPPDYGKSRDPLWFSVYKLDPGKRVVKRTLDETIEKYFQLMELSSQVDTNEESKLAYEKAKQQPMFKEPVLCTYHQAMLEQAQQLKDELTVKARDRCLDMADPRLPNSRVRRRRIIDQLEYDIEASLERYYQAMRTDQLKVLALKDDSCVVCQEALVKIAWPKPGQKAGRALVGEHCPMAHTATTEAFAGRRLSGGGLNSDPPETEEVSFRLAGGGLHMDKIDFNLEPVPKTPIEVDDCEGHSEAPKSHITFLLDGKKIKHMALPRAKPGSPLAAHQEELLPGTWRPLAVQFSVPSSAAVGPTKALRPGENHHKVDCKGTREIAEEMTGETGPLVQPFKKLLPELKDEEPNGQQYPASKDSTFPSSETTESLEESSDHSTRSHVDHKAEIVDAVVRCAKAIWTKKAAIKRAEMDRNERVNSKHSLRPEVLHCDMEHFNPDDDELMDRMLADGMRELKKSHRFVLATLPDYHKIPVLRQWIKRRYGKVYSWRELQDNLNESLEVFEKVTRLQSHPPRPDKMGLTTMPESRQNYAYHKQTMAEADRVRNAYFTRLNNAYLEQMTACWYAMGKNK
ncbi:LOW QUALITY PROTEIN: uncharacterized protein LOC108160693, partial [Drosophila miranda]|uniref:LOW QUALITY PROTEIN: uncharacterized protein LOC108160693 n=1 Tax=Drosophila miranda TaxID=7229 RepID=UPI00143FA2BE